MPASADNNPPARPVPFRADQNSGRPFSLIATSADTRLALHATVSSERMAAWAIPPQNDRARLGRLDQGPGSSAHVGQFWSLTDAAIAAEYARSGAKPGETSIYPPFRISYLANQNFERVDDPEKATICRWEVEHDCRLACERLIFVQNAVIHGGMTDLSAAHITWLAPSPTTGTSIEYANSKTRPYSHTGDIPAWDPLTFVEDWGNNLALCYYHHTASDGYRSFYADSLIRDGQWPTAWPIEGKFLLYRNQYRQPFDWVWHPREGYRREPRFSTLEDQAYVRNHFETKKGSVPGNPGREDSQDQEVYIQKLLHWRPVSIPDQNTTPLASYNALEAIRNFILFIFPEKLANSVREDTAFDIAIHADNYNVYTRHRVNSSWYELDYVEAPWRRDDWKWIKGTPSTIGGATGRDYCSSYVSRLDIWVRQLAHCPPLNWPPAQEGGAA